MMDSDIGSDRFLVMREIN